MRRNRRVTRTEGGRHENRIAKDAFQAVFLALAQRALDPRDQRALATWLREVALRIAIRARIRASRQRARERQIMAMAPPRDEPGDRDEIVSLDELRPMLHEEVVRLPERYRLPLILSYLEGKTNEEVAELLRWPIGTVKGRLSRGREMLRSRLTRRGVAPSAAFLVTTLSRCQALVEPLPAELVVRTVRLATRAGSRRSSSRAAYPTIIHLISTRAARLMLGAFLLLVISACLSIASMVTRDGG